MTVLLIILAIIVFILVVPLGVRAAYLEETLYLAARVLCFDIRVLPRKERPEKAKKPPKPKKPKKPKKGKEEPGEGKEPQPKKKPTLTELLELARIGLDALSNFRRKLTVNNFMLHLKIAAEDPYDAAMLYGYVNTALSLLEPKAKGAFNVRRSDVQTAVDFESTDIEAEAELIVTISLGRILAVAISAGIAFLKLKKKQKREMSRADNADERTDNDGSTDTAAQPDGGNDAGEHGENQGDGGC